MFNRRTALALAAGALGAPKTALAASALEITWDDLIPPGVPYSEIIGEGEIDAINDTWNPVYDANAVKLNKKLDGAYIRMPGYVIPFDVGSEGVRDFILVPYVGACIHTPPPPANQLVMVRTEKPWKGTDLWDPVWVTGVLRLELQSTNLGDIGYALTAQEMEVYEW